MRFQPVNPRPPSLRPVVLASVFSISLSLLCVGCSDRIPVLEDDSEAIKALKKAGAQVTRGLAPGLPNARAYVVDLSDVKVDSSIAELLGQEEALGALTLTGKRVTDDTLAQIAESATLKNLTMLDLTGAAVTDAGLKHLSVFPKLGTLSLDDTQVTGPGLADIPVTVTSLGLANLPIDDDELQMLKHLKRLKGIRLQGTQVTAAAATKFEASKGCIVQGIKRDASGFAKKMFGR